ncbi:MAG: patatin-like phospholipase family protein [Gammaproteobacteria bacterium]
MITQQKTNKTRIGIALSSGSVRGVYAHSGFVLALQEMGLDISAITGCSAGAVVGGIFASGQNMQTWSTTLSELNPSRFWQPSWFRLFWSLIIHKWRGYSGISSTNAAKEFCIEQLKVQKYSQCEIPFYALAINIGTGAKTIFHEGELAATMVASAAVPVLYEPVEINGELYSDGALLELTATDAICCKHDLDVLIVHHVAEQNNQLSELAAAFKQPWTLIKILNLFLYRHQPWYLSNQLLTFQHCPCGCNALIIIVNPNLPPIEWPKTNNGRDILKSALEQTLKSLEPYIDNIKFDIEALNKIALPKNPENNN